LASSTGREAVKLRFALVFGFTPFAANPALVFEAVKSWVERALQDFQAILGDLLNTQKNAVAV
jgi:hypothetical protein